MVQTEITPQPSRPAPRPSGKREQTKQQNRQIILEAARQVFAEHGYGATTVRDIIRATPLASGTFYNYFQSKEEVFQAIRDETALAIRPQLREARVNANTIDEFISATFRVFFEYVARAETNFQVMRKDVHATRMRVDTPEVIAGFEELREDLEKAIGRGILPQIDADFLMASIVGVAFEVAERMMMREAPNPLEAAEFATALFMGGIRTLPHVAGASSKDGGAAA